MLKRIFSHTAIYGLAPHVSKIASLFVLPVITQDLTELDYGVAGTLTAYTGVISVLSTLGLRLILVNTFYKSPNQYKWAWRQIYGFLSLWVIPYTLILGLLLYKVVPNEASDNTISIVLLNILPIVAFGNTSTLGTTYFQINKQPLQVGVRTAIFGVLAVFLNLFTISYLKLGYMGWFWTSFIVGILSNVSYWIPINIQLGITPIFNFKWKTIRGYLKRSLPTVPHYYSSYLLNSSDRMVMDWLKIGTGDIGKYNIAYTIGGYVERIAIASGLAINPMLNEYYKQGEDKRARDLIFLLQIIFWLMTFIISLWLKEIFYILIKNNVLSEMYPLAIIIVMSYNYRPMYYGANSKLFYTENTKQLWKITTVAGISNLVLNFFLIPFYGFQIAAVTTFVSLMYMGYAGFFMKKFREITKVKYYPLFWISGSIFITVLAYYLVELNLLYKIFITTIILLIGGLTVRIFNSKNLGKKQNNKVYN
ncbi:lipopolysaccharide biosynthesis protein [Pontibacter ramchanderi]|uniref:O-antigen/teichoic acid export membrane protein n=1 Tax=Pontibacter ramchanderi TaxID=1179743 RepID=A0A2N3U914_9BACT|nr:oligosaccharide flippase family protein [Pontibacter ramchanderi]PKV63225.1 O-antigen/teichoic acid export membrane protein [Pontibacter ramchanderi]